MSVVLALLTAHMLADFPFQTNKMAAKKFDSIHYRAWHAHVHAVFAGVLAFPFVTNTQTVIVLFTVGALHFLIDTKRWAEPKDGFEQYPLAVDQAFHVASLYVVILILHLL